VYFFPAWATGVGRSPWEDGVVVNMLDLVILGLVVLSVSTGFRRGAAMQVSSYIGLVVGLLVGALLAPQIAEMSDRPSTQATVAMVTLLVSGGLGDLLGWLVGAKVGRALGKRGLGSADAAAGILVSVTTILLTTWFLAFNLVQGPFPALSRQIRESAVVRGLDAVLPRPPSLLAQVRQFLNRFGFPEVFAGLPPPPARPVPDPSRGQVSDAIQAADQSTVKVIGEACGRIQEGSGFFVSEGYLLTNAHVVAGVDTPHIQRRNGVVSVATVTLFDPDLDVAILRFGASGPDPLPLATTDLDRGARGAVLGYPGGGPLEADAAAVRRAITAAGRDIYGDETVRRRVYELQAEIRPGHSGGPFVAVDGSIAGVVFAASTTNEEVGYALTASQVRPQIEIGTKRTEAVDTGECLR
jgi:S1-C subfamily serine protease